MEVKLAPRPTVLRHGAAMVALGACALAAAVTPSAAAAPAAPGQRASGTTVTMRWYTRTVEFVHERADGTIVKDPDTQPAAGDTVHIYELGYRGTVGLEAWASGDSEQALARFRAAFTRSDAPGAERS